MQSAITVWTWSFKIQVCPVEYKLHSMFGIQLLEENLWLSYHSHCIDIRCLRWLLECDLYQKLWTFVWPYQDYHAGNSSGNCQGFYSLSVTTSYYQISLTLEAMRVGVKIVISFWNLTGSSAAMPVKFQNDQTITHTSHGFEILWDLVVRYLTA